MKPVERPDELHGTLLNSYTEENLTRISTRLIDAFRKKQFRYIRGLYNSLKTFMVTDEQSINKIFSALIMLYHPDRLNHYRSKLEGQINPGSAKDLHPFSHILIMLEKLKQAAPPDDTEPETDFGMDVEYGFEKDEFDRIFDTNDDLYQDFEQMDMIWDEPLVRNFIDIMCERENLDDDFEVRQYHLENLEGALDLSSTKMSDLSGIEHCVNLTSLDLSSNQLLDITPLGYLRSLQELYLSGNEIYAVDALGQMDLLKILDLSFNNIDDASPLFDLPALEYVNLIGNRIPRAQVEFLGSKGVMVVI